MAMLDPRQRRRQGMAASAPGLARRTGRALLFQFRQDGGLVFGKRPAKSSSQSLVIP